MIVEDGRVFLDRGNRGYDVIVSDLFNPHVDGVSELYSREHFELVSQNLNDGGVFAQWIPLYQLSERELGSIFKTMLQIFPEVSIWRGNFTPDKATVVLIGCKNCNNFLDPELLKSTLDSFRMSVRDEVFVDFLASTKGLSVLVANPDGLEQLQDLSDDLAEFVPFTFYVGSVSKGDRKFDKYPVIIYDKPSFDYWAMSTLFSSEDNLLTDANLVNLYSTLLSDSDEDEYLEKLSNRQRDYVRAGLSYQKFVLFDYYGKLTQNSNVLDEAQKWLSDYADKTSPDK